METCVYASQLSSTVVCTVYFSSGSCAPSCCVHEPAKACFASAARTTGSPAPMWLQGEGSGQHTDGRGSKSREYSLHPRREARDRQQLRVPFPLLPASPPILAQTPQVRPSHPLPNAHPLQNRVRPRPRPTPVHHAPKRWLGLLDLEQGFLDFRCVGLDGGRGRVEDGRLGGLVRDFLGIGGKGGVDNAADGVDEDRVAARGGEGPLREPASRGQFVRGQGGGGETDWRGLGYQSAQSARSPTSASTPAMKAGGTKPSGLHKEGSAMSRPGCLAEPRGELTPAHHSTRPTPKYPSA